MSKNEGKNNNNLQENLTTVNYLYDNINQLIPIITSLIYINIKQS